MPARRNRIGLSALTLVVAASATAVAQPLPVRREAGKACPDGYTGSSGYCVPKSANSRQAIPRDGNKPCPHGYNASGSACLSTQRN